MHRRRPPSAPALPKKILSLRRRLENLRKTARKLDRASSALGQLFRTLEESDHVYNELVFEAARDSHSVQKKVALAMGTDDAGRSTVLSVHPLSTDTSFHSRERRLFELQALETGLRHRLRSYAPPYTRKDMLVPMLEREAQYASLFLRHARMCQEHASMLRAEVLSAQRLLVTPTNTQNNKHATSRFVANVFADLHSITSLIDTLALRAKMLEQAEQSRVQPPTSSDRQGVRYQRAQRTALLDSRTLRTVAFDAEHFDAKKTTKQRLVEEEMRAMDMASTSSRLAGSSRSRTLSRSRGPFGLYIDPSIELRPIMLGANTSSFVARQAATSSSTVFDRTLPSILLSDLDLPFEKTLEKMGKDRSKQKMPRLQTNGKQLVERDQWILRV
jgi:hypothetical protein